MRRIGELLGAFEPQERASDEPRGRQHPARPAAGAAPPDVCPICQGRGFLVYDVPPGHPDFNRLVACRCTEARLAAERTRAIRTFSNLGALDRMTFDTFLPDGVGLPEGTRRALHEAYEISMRYAKDPRGWLVLLGSYGAGKTHLAAAIANHNVALGRGVLFVVVPDLLDHLRGAFGPNSDSDLEERLDAIRDASLLILDDLGAHNATPWAQEKLFQILNYRYNNRLSTVITSNQRLEELDPRVTSRLGDLDVSQIFEIPAPDFRAGQTGMSGFDRGGRSLSSLALHHDQTFETFSLRINERMEADQHESLRKALGAARAFAENPAGWLVLNGTYGCGKTHLAAAIANHQVAIGRPTPMFVVVPDLLDHLRATFSPTSTTTLDRLFEQVRTAPLLILDDLGTESATPWAREKLFQLLNYRYAARLPTVITTYNTLEELDQRLASRMMDSRRCTVCHIIALSFRGSESQRTPDLANVDKDGRTRTRRSKS